MEKIRIGTIDIRVDLGQFSEYCRACYADQGKEGFSKIKIQELAQEAAERPFTWNRKHQRFFDYISGEVCLKNSTAFNDGVYIITEELP